VNKHVIGDTEHVHHRLLNMSSPITKNIIKRPKFRDEHRHPLPYKLEFGVARVQDDPSKIMNSAVNV
jgi:hypothetical protein